jgi:hypothetical protein
MSFQNPLFEFVTNENVDLLWEVILENKEVKNKEQFRNYFIENLKSFLQEEQQVERTKLVDLVETNKKFITQFITRVNSKTNSATSNSSTNTSGAFVTAEEIQKNRMNEFEQEFFKKQNEFKQFMTHHVPEAPQFTDTTKEEPIGENMEKLIAMTLAKRNFDMEQLQPSVDKQQVEKWLKGEGTSVKPVDSKMDSKMDSKNEPKIKYIKIGDEIQTVVNTIEIGDPEKSKKVSWDDDMAENRKEMQTQLFSKLKQVTEETHNDEHNLKMLEKMEMMMKKIDELNNKLNTFMEEKRCQL